MRLGGGTCNPYSTPAEWLSQVRELGYSAVIFPLNSSAPKEQIAEYLSCIRDAGLLIGEVGVWKNVMSPNAYERAQALDYAKRQLELAEYVGARCCVNIAGSTGSRWDGYDPYQGTQEYYDRVVETTQEIIDSVSPEHTAYSLEPMPWMAPESPEQYLQLIRDIDRKGFKAHLDYCNMLNSLDRYRDSSAFIEHCFDILGEHIVSIHAKDAYLIDSKLPLSITEIQPGEGSVDLGLVMKRAHALGEDTPVFIEHLPNHDTYLAAARTMRALAQEAGVPVK